MLADRLERELQATEQILAQTDLRLQGQRTIPDRRISLVDPDARPIRMGSPRQPTEFGYKARIADTAEGFVIADVPHAGNPAVATPSRVIWPEYRQRTVHGRYTREQS